MESNKVIFFALSIIINTNIFSGVEIAQQHQGTHHQTCYVSTGILSTPISNLRLVEISSSREHRITYQSYHRCRSYEVVRLYRILLVSHYTDTPIYMYPHSRFIRYYKQKYHPSGMMITLNVTRTRSVSSVLLSTPRSNILDKDKELRINLNICRSYHLPHSPLSITKLSSLIHFPLLRSPIPPLNQCV